MLPVLSLLAPVTGNSSGGTPAPDADYIVVSVLTDFIIEEITYVVVEVDDS